MAHKKDKTKPRELTGDDPVIKWLAGGEKAKPHSSKEGRLASAGRKFDRILKKMRPNMLKRPPGGWTD